MDIGLHQTWRFGKQYILNGLRFLLKKLGYVYKQFTVVPGKADSEKQKDFAKDIEEIKDNLAQKN